MTMSRCLYTLIAFAAAAALTVAAPVPKARPGHKAQPPNDNALVKAYKDRLAFTRSSDWQGWPPDKAFDGNADTSWFSATGDTPTGDKRPWLAVTFPHDVAVRRVTVLGNREPSSPIGYSALVGRLELLDKDGRAVIRAEREGKGDRSDFDFVLSEPFGRVRTVRFTVVKDDTSEGRSQTRCVGVAEVQIE
ncbi:MAG TPA: discoidin domain-containing protein [Fimbriiglobus sp.]|nr:discoidin domain-containing protein [Fimbriiglobus sp.]